MYQKGNFMQIRETNVSSLSEYYIYTPSTLARKLYLYPLIVGHSFYEPGYLLQRNNFNNFLIMYISKGECSILADGRSYSAKAGEFVLLDCYKPHQYGHSDAWEAVWVHFDGILAREYFQEITSHHGNVLKLDNSKLLSYTLQSIYDLFRTAAPIVESSLSKHITSILDGLLTAAPSGEKSLAYSHIVADSIAFISEHFAEQISLEDIAGKSHLSLYHFARLFAQETGATPHQYLIRTRIAAAQYMLKSTDISVKAIAYNTGFNSESNFCYTFKKWTGVTPSQYRDSPHALTK